MLLHLKQKTEDPTKERIDDLKNRLEKEGTQIGYLLKKNYMILQKNII